MRKIQGFLLLNLWGQVRTLRTLPCVMLRTRRKTETEKEDREREREREEAMTRLPLSLPSFPSPCAHSKRPHVCVENLPVCTGNMPTRFIHVGMLLVHTGTC